MATLNHPRKAVTRDGLCLRWAGSPWKSRRSEPTRTGTGPATVDGPSQSPNDDRTNLSQVIVRPTNHQRRDGGDEPNYADLSDESTRAVDLSLIHISEPTRRTPISY